LFKQCLTLSLLHTHTLTHTHTHTPTQGTCRGTVEVAVSKFKQCVPLSLSHSLSLSLTHTQTRDLWSNSLLAFLFLPCDMLLKRERGTCRTTYGRAVHQTSRERLNSSSGANSDAFFESSAWIQAPAHIFRRRSSRAGGSLKCEAAHTSRRCSKTSKCIRNIEKV
jgi:hypothetical protein